jgi:hypothetical protein
MEGSEWRARQEVSSERRMKVQERKGDYAESRGTFIDLDQRALMLMRSVCLQQEAEIHRTLCRQSPYRSAQDDIVEMNAQSSSSLDLNSSLDSPTSLQSSYPPATTNFFTSIFL